MKRIPGWLLIIVVIGLLIASKFLFFPKDSGKIGPKPKGGAPAEMPVNYFVARTSTFSNNLFAAGRIGALNQVDLVPETAGRVTAIYFKEGETVKQGSALLKINDADLQAQLAKVRTQLRLSDQKLKRVQKLLDVEGVSREEFEMQENELAALKADENYLLAQIAKTTLTAPFTGMIGLRNVSEGAFVNASTPVVSLVQMKPVYVEFSVPEKYHLHFREGLRVQFGVGQEDSASLHTARIYAIEPRVDEATKTIRARALYEGPFTFYPGSFVRVNVELGQVPDAILLPSQCVIPTAGGQKVIVSRRGEAAEVKVTIGMRTDRAIEITSGVSAGDTIVASGLLGVKPGAKLKLTNQVN
jgi:membrane fusion protein, multidrug efflux system